MAKLRTWLTFAGLSLAACIALSACAAKDDLKRRHDTLTADLAEVEMLGAKVCAPMEYASAEAYLDFAADEWAERDYSRARRHLDQARTDLAAARDLSAGCIDKSPPDSDGDGLTDDQDACPNVAEDMDGWEDTDGCPETDNDGDGIADASDKCPNEPETKNGVDDLDGCPDAAFKKIQLTKEQIILKEAIHFESGKATVLVDSYPILDEVVSALKAHPGIRIRVEGHTDSVGSRDFNLKLSEKRARAVTDYLSGHGIAASRMIPEGYGPDRPVAPNNTERGQAKNRRVEIHIIK